MSAIEGKVVAIFISPEKGEKYVPMVAVDSVVAHPGGLIGDRYDTGGGREGTGAFSQNSKRVVRRDVTLISEEDIQEANKEHGTDFEAVHTRRNIVTSGIDLRSLVGREFSVAGVRMIGLEEAKPCERPSVLSEKPDFKQTFDGRGGLRAEIIDEGSISIGDGIQAEA